jgi:hypothetical protein
LFSRILKLEDFFVPITIFKLNIKMSSIKTRVVSLQREKMNRCPAKGAQILINTAMPWSTGIKQAFENREVEHTQFLNLF